MTVRRDLLLSGVISPVVTPLCKDRSLDQASFERLVEFELEGGVSALFVLGTGGEGPYLDMSQREDVVASAVKLVRGRVPIVVGISDIGTARALRNLELSLAAGVDGLVSTPPFYGEVSEAEIDLHFRTLAQAAKGLPLYAYDIPSKVGVKIPVTTTLRLAHEGVIRGIKDSSGDMDEFRRLCLALAGLDGFSLLTGSDSSADMALFEQADGMIAGMANVDPHGFARMYRAALSKDWAAARTEQDRLFSLRDITRAGLPRVSSFSATIGSFKAALVHRGVIECDALQLPLCELDDREKSVVADLVERAGLGPVAPA